MKIIDDAIYQALRQLREECGTNLAFAKRLGISDSLVTRILLRKSQFFKDKTWEKIEPSLRPFLSSTCAQGYVECPLADKKLEKLLKNILEINDPVWYNMLNGYVEEQKKIYKQHTITSIGEH